MICIIPARGGSKRIPRKNLQIVGGMTLVERAYRLALSCKAFTRVLVATDDDEIAALFPNGNTLKRRPSSDDEPTAYVVSFAREELSQADGSPMAILQCTTPELCAADLFWATHIAEREYWIVATTNHDGARNGFYVLRGCICPVDGPVPWLAVPTTRQYIDINTPEDLAEVRRRFGDPPA